VWNFQECMEDSGKETSDGVRTIRADLRWLYAGERDPLSNGRKGKDQGEKVLSLPERLKWFRSTYGLNCGGLLGTKP